MTPHTPDHASTRAATVTAPDAGHRRASLRRAALLLAVGLPILGATAAAGRYWWPADEAQTLSSALPGAVRALPDTAPGPVWQPAFSLPEIPPAPRLAVAPPAEAPLPRTATMRAAPDHAPARSMPLAARLPDDADTVTAAPTARHPEPSRDAAERTGTLPPAPATDPGIPLPAPALRTEVASIAEATRTAPTPANPARDEAATTNAGTPPPAALVALTQPPVVPPSRPQTATLAAPNFTAPGTAAPVETGLARSPVPPARPARLARRPEAPGAGDTAAVVPAALAAPAAPPPATTLALAPPLASDAAPDRCDSRLTRAIPRRPRGAEGGQTALARLASASGATRDAAIVEAIAAGNLPDHLRRLVPVTLTGTATDGRAARITLCVMPDYLALGSDEDFVRVPLGLPAARAIADRFDMVLPTTLMVDAIHAQARLRLTPAPMTPGPQMESTDYFVRHNATLEGQRRAARAPLGLLVSGHKKDLVLTNRLDTNPGRVAIYGWHQASGRPIQPLSTVHGAQYADYSHGIRLISRTAWVNGRATDLRDLLADSRLAGLLSHEGPIAPRVMLAALR